MILLASFPKSGSTFICNNMASILGYKSIFIPGPQKTKRAAQNLLTNDQDLSYSKLLRYANRNLVSQGHTVASAENMGLIRHFDIQTVVLVRNIFDVCLSFRDHLVKQPGVLHYAMPVSESFRQWPLDRQLDFIIDLVVPWYVKFYVSWYKQAPFFANYEHMVLDQVSFFRRVFLHLGVEICPEDIAGKIDNTQQQEWRFNVGKIGRGRSLSAVQKQRILAQFSYFPEVDFDQIVNYPAVRNTGCDKNPGITHAQM
jgi:Sulfotransferase domain